MKTSRVLSATAGAAIALTLALTGCAAPKESPGDDTAATLSSASQRSIDDAVERALGLSHADQAIVGVWSSDGDYVRGYASNGADDVDANTLFRSAQTSQPALCALLLDLVEEGKLRLDREVSQDLTRQSGIGSVTYGQLCNGTSGFADFKPRFEAIVTDNPARTWPTGELLAESFIQGSLSWPGLDVHRSDTNAIVLGKALAMATNQQLDDLLEERVFIPAGMLSSVQATASTGQLTEFDNALTETTFASGPQCDAGVTTLTQVSPSILGAAGGTIANVGDIKRFYEHYLGGTFGGSALQGTVTETRPMINPKRDEEGNPLAEDPEVVSPTSYGFGLINAGPLWGADGKMPGTISSAWHDPETGFTVVVALNNSSAGASFATNLAHEIAALLGGAGDAWTAEEKAEALVAGAVCQPEPEPEPENSEESADEPAA